MQICKFDKYFKLFLLYINDMPYSLIHSVPSLYADNAEIYASSDNFDDLVDKMNFDLQNIHKLDDSK